MIPISDRNPTTRKPIVTLVLVVICTAIYFLVQPTPLSTTAADLRFDLKHSAVPYELWKNRPMNACDLSAGLVGGDPIPPPCPAVTGTAPVHPGKHVWLSVFVSIFLHGSIAHLGFNMLFLWIFGNNTEDRLGHLKYALFYVAGGLVATGAYVMFNMQSRAPVIGASGAIAATMGAYLIWFPKARVTTLVAIFPVPLPAWAVLGVWFLMQFFTNPNSGVAWIAHVAGFIFGVLIALSTNHLRAAKPAFERTTARPGH